MAERRMFTQKITESDAFIEMPMSSQALYFHLCMNADDDGFVKNPKSIQRLVGCNDDDLKLLIAKRFIIPFDTGVIVIKHWRMHNLLRKDRYKETVYIEEKALLYLKKDGAYTLDQSQGRPIPKIGTSDQPSDEKEADESVATDCQPNGNQMAPQDRLGKDRVGYTEESKKENINNNSSSAGARGEEPLESYDDLMTKWEVGPMVRAALWKFIQHCDFNGRKVTNDKLEDIIDRLQSWYCYAEYGDNADKEQSDAVYRAINGGYFDIKVWRK